jgi:hypothetical protein
MKTEGKRPFERPKSRWEGTINTSYEIGPEDVSYISLAKDKKTFGGLL